MHNHAQWTVLSCRPDFSRVYFESLFASPSILPSSLSPTNPDTNTSPSRWAACTSPPAPCTASRALLIGPGTNSFCCTFVIRCIRDFFFFLHRRHARERPKGLTRRWRMCMATAQALLPVALGLLNQTLDFERFPLIPYVCSPSSPERSGRPTPQWKIELGLIAKEDTVNRSARTGQIYWVRYKTTAGRLH